MMILLSRPWEMQSRPFYHLLTYRHGRVVYLKRLISLITQTGALQTPVNGNSCPSDGLRVQAGGDGYSVWLRES
jgi:hypothetical protein